MLGPVWEFLALAGLAAALTWLSRRYAVHRRLLDQPGDRRSHVIPTPRGGGIAIVLVVTLTALWLLVRNPATLGAEFGSFLLGLWLVAGIGWWDDHRPLSPWVRLAVQAVAALVLAWGMQGAQAGILPFLYVFGAAMVLVNVWNFMDGINGLAVSQALLAATCFALLLEPGPWACLAVALAAACVGFLPFNFPKAVIFLGDVGSSALGFVLAALCGRGLGEGGFSWWIMVFPLLPFLLDAGFTLIARMLAGKRWWEPHVEHAYQHAARAHGHVPVTLVYALFTGISVIFTLSLSSLGPGFAAVAAMLVGRAAWVLWKATRKGRRP